MYTLTEQSSIAMSNAVKNGVIDTVLHPFGNPFIAALLKRADEEKAIEPQNPQTFEAYENPKSQRWQESVFDPIGQGPSFFAVELARFTVPKGQVGFVRFLDQILVDSTGSYYPTNREYWGSPHFVDPDVDNCRWYLTLSYFDGTLPPRFLLASPTIFGSDSLPGEPYPDLHEVPNMFYPVHAPRDNMKLIVPGNRMLRFYFYTPGTQNYSWLAQGRLAGFTQSTYNDEATENARVLS